MTLRKCKYSAGGGGGPSVVEVRGVIRLDIGGVSGGVLQPVQDLGIEGRGHLVHHLTSLVLLALTELRTSLDGVLHSDD